MFDGGALRRINLETKVIEEIPLTLPKDQSVVSLISGAEGEALILSEKGAWVHDEKGTRKLCDAGEVEDLSDLAVAPPKVEGLADWLFVAGTDKESVGSRLFYSRKPGQKSFSRTFCRRVHSVGSGVFTADGRFFFDEGGDLWEGNFEAGDGDGMMTTLNGVRIAPLGFLNTDGANGGSMYVSNIMPAGTGIYVALQGHHMGQLLRVTKPMKPATSEGSSANDTVKEHYAYLAKSLASVQIIDDSGEPIRNCAATVVNGVERVFFAKGGSSLTLYLWDNATKTAVEVGAVESK